MSLIKRTLILPFKISRMRGSQRVPSESSPLPSCQQVALAPRGRDEHAAMSFPSISRSLSESDCPRCGAHQARETWPRRPKSTKTTTRDCYISEISSSDCPRCGEHQPRETLPRRPKSSKTTSTRDCSIDPYQPTIETFMRTTGNSQTCYSKGLYKNYITQF